MLASTKLAVATGVEPVPPDRQSGILPPDPATDLKCFGCEGTIRTCMNRVRAGYPGQLDDLAVSQLERREHSDTVFFLEREVTVPFTTPQNLLPVNLVAGERVERSLRVPKAHVLPLNDPAISYLRRSALHLLN